MRKYELTKQIPARKKAELMEAAKHATTKKEIFEKAKEIAIFYGKKFGWSYEDTKTVIYSLFACGLCVMVMESTETVFDYMVSYVNWKLTVYNELNDLGAIGDMIETIVHLVAMRKVWRTNKNNLHVSAIGKTDVTINGIKFEVGHNGKTWADSTLTDAMHGPFDGVVYGVFDNEEIKAITDLFANKQVNEGVKTVCNMLYVFPNKYEYLDFIDGISKRSATIVWKDNLNHFKTVYNGSKHSAFIQAIENSEFSTLTEYMKNLSNNDWLE